MFELRRVLLHSGDTGVFDNVVKPQRDTQC